jgi:DivIVA domain-containing protein
MPLTPEAVRNKQFTTVRLREGYDEDEVDAFLDEVEAELTRLLRENEELRAQLDGAGAAPALAGATRVETPPAETAPAETAPAPVKAEAPAPPAEAPVPADRAATATPDSAARLLVLAQRTADEAVAEARAEADKIVTEARSQAEAREREARARAEALEQQARVKHDETLGSLETQRQRLEHRIDELRAFEREYRSRLKSYLQSQLAELEGRGEGGAGLAPAAG